MKLPAKHKALIEKLQARYPFKLPLAHYYMGKTGRPEEIVQKTFYHCVKDNFPEEVGYEIETVIRSDKKGGNYDREVCHAVIVATADFVDNSTFQDKYGNRISKKMVKAKQMGYQPGTIDFIVFYPSHGFSAWGCEVKAGKNTADKTQRKTVSLLSQRGMSCHVCREFPEMLESWLTYLGY